MTKSLPPGHADDLIKKLHHRARWLTDRATVAMPGDAELVRSAAVTLSHQRQALADALAIVNSMDFSVEDLMKGRDQALISALEDGLDAPEDDEDENAAGK